MRHGYAAIVLAACAHAHAITGNQAVALMMDRNGDPLNTLLAFADGLMWGEAGTLINAKTIAKSGRGRYLVPFCAPQGATAIQAAQIIAMELRSNPAGNHEQLALISRKALIRAWPCSEEQLLSD